MSKKPMESKTTFKWVFMDIIPYTHYKSLTKYTTFNNYLLIFGCLLQNSKTLWNGKYYHQGIHGQTRYVLGKNWKSR